MRNKSAAIAVAFALLSVTCGGTGGGAPAGDKSPIVIGYNDALSGPNGDFTVKTQRGFQLGLDEVNNSGGIDGRPIKLITYDTAGDDAKSVTNAQKLINEDKVLAMLGPSPSTNALAVVPVAEQQKIVYITWAWQTDIIKSQYIFRISNNQAFAADPLLKYVIGAGFKRIAITAETTARGDEETLVETKSVQQQTGAPPAAVIRYAPGAADFTPVAVKLKEANADVVYQNGSSAGDICNQMKAAKRLGVDPKVVWVGPVYAIPSVPKVCGNDVVAGAVFSIFVDYGKKEVKDLQAQVTAKWKDTVDYGYVQGYDTAHVLAAALKKPGATTDRQSFLAAMQSVKDVPAVGGPPGYKITFFTSNESHDAYGATAQVLVAWNDQGLPSAPARR